MMRTVDFEVFGRVQGVFFRKNTADKAKKLGLKGWVMNTRHNTVIGTVQGDDNALEDMKHWLSHVGSPHSRIDKCDFKNEKPISSYEFNSFDVKH